MRYLHRLIHRLARLFAHECIFGERRFSVSMDMPDLFDEEFGALGSDVPGTGDFKIFSSNDDYNKELLNVFQYSGKRVILDYNHRDGHFRV